MTTRGTQLGILAAVPCLLALGIGQPQVASSSGAWVGMTTANARIEVSPEQQGRIVKLHVHEGDSIEEGQLLFELSTRWQEIEIDRLRILADSRLEIREAQADYDHALKEQERAVDLHQRGIAGGADLDDKAHAAEVAETRLERANRQQKTRLLQWNEAKARLEQRRVRSPLNGHGANLFCMQGQSVEENQTVMTVVSLQPMWVEFACPVEEADLIDTGTELVVRQTANPDRNALAKVIHASMTADPSSQTFKVRLEMDNAKNPWRSGLKVWIETKDYAQGKPGRLPRPGK